MQGIVDRIEGNIVVIEFNDKMYNVDKTKCSEDIAEGDVVDIYMLEDEITKVVKNNKATYSSDLCKQLLNIYCPKDGIVYDPFMGTGTTAVACKELGLSYIGSELSENQCKWANDRLLKVGDAV